MNLSDKLADEVHNSAIGLATSIQDYTDISNQELAIFADGALITME